MPFSSLSDPVDLARAEAALDAAWAEIRPKVSEGHEDQERTRLIYIIAALAAASEDERELKDRALARYRHWYTD